jgi:polyprenyldihydroxybenzoate methyltransferase / 3-demethylubiquinol 3-O-methyltransferase
VYAEGLALAGAEVVGIDPGIDLIRAAKEHAELTKKTHPDLKLEYYSELIEDHVKTHECFYDVVVSSEVVEHVPSPSDLLEHSIKALKHGGSIFVTTINRNFSSFIFVWLIWEWILGMIPRGGHNFWKFVKPEEVEEIFIKNNCHKVASTGFFTRLWTRKFSFTKDERMHYGIHGMKNYDHEQKAQSFVNLQTKLQNAYID